MYRLSAITLNDNDPASLPLDVNGNLIVTNAAGAAFGVSVVDLTAYSSGVTKGTPALGVYQTSAPTLTNGQITLVQLDVNGNELVREQYAPGYEDNVANVAKVEQRFSFLNIVAGTATTVVKASAGFLHTITLNSAALATNVTTVYDNASGVGTVIAIPAATTATVPTTLTYDVSFANGLTIITATANGSNMTISYR